MKVDGGRLLEAFRRYLADHALPVTQQRLAVAEVIFFSGAHLSAEEIAERVAARGAAVATATVYRTLDLLVRSGLVQEHDFGDGFRRYEPGGGGGGGGGAAGTIWKDPHEHCICSACGAVSEFSNDRLERMIALLAEEVEFRPHHHRLDVYGLCRSCQQSNPLARAR
ncbi:MAG: Fur family transcriptional regulator [Gemmatimonadales bacterium]